jgi:uncharacterized membrane protein
MRPALALALLALSAAACRAEYVFTTLDVPGATSTTISGVSPDGRYVAGSYTDAGGIFQHAFVWDGTTFTTLNYPGTMSTYAARGVNSAGDVVGNYNANVYPYFFGFLYSGGGYTSLGGVMVP